MARKTDQQKALEGLTTQIRVALVERGMTQKELAALLFIPQTTLSGWIRHPETMTLKNLQRLNSVLALDPLKWSIAGGFVQRKEARP